MKYRYGYNNKGKITRIAKVYSKQEHNIKLHLIEKSAQNIIKTLVDKGYQAYIVGGAIRDILLGSIPKDFDIATNASPANIKKLFKRAKIIGRRFRIVLIPIGSNDFIEVTTFRSDIEEHNQYSPNAYGSMDQDVKRRDFTCNAMYYNTIKEELIDYVGAFTHIKKRKLIPIRTHFEEDPVRMLRTLKFSTKCNLKVSRNLLSKIRKQAPLIAQVSRSRLTEELFKILTCGHSAAILKRCYDENLLRYIVPEVYKWLSQKQPKTLHSSDKKTNTRLDLFLSALEKNDMLSDKKQTRSSGFTAFTRAFIQEYIYTQKKHGHKVSTNKALAEIKHWVSPITPPNIEIQKAILSLLPNTSKSAFKKKPRRKPNYKREGKKETT